MKLHVKIPAVYQPLLAPSRYLGAWGGRGSGKSHFFAWKAIKKSILTQGTRIVCIREVQKTLKESSKRLIEDKLLSLGLGSPQGFEFFQEHTQTPGGGIITYVGMQDRNAENIKSLEGYDVAWIEEAQTLSQRSLDLLRPTIRKEGSELWFSWNPRRKQDAVDKLLRAGELPTGATVIRANWSDNPYFPEVLNQERLDCLRLQPEQYGHIWNGDYISVVSGAYYAKVLAAARESQRVGNVGPDPLLPFKAAIDIGGTGAKSDAFSCWIWQNVGKEVRVLDYYEAVGQELSTHITWLNSNGYRANNTRIYLPHDGATHDKVFAVSYESAFKSAGYNVEVIPNQGTGAAMLRVEAGRRIFPSCWFNGPKCQGGIDALGWYHEKTDETRQIGLGPDHDWSSHGADAFGLLAVVSEKEILTSRFDSNIDYTNLDRLNIA